jgi:hypothetical protein
MDCQRIGLLPCGFNALDRHKILRLLVHCIAKLPPKPKKVLALYYHEDFSLADIATGFGLTENEINQMRAKTLRVLQMMLTTQLCALLPRSGKRRSRNKEGVIRFSLTLPNHTSRFNRVSYAKAAGTLKTGCSPTVKRLGFNKPEPTLLTDPAAKQRALDAELNRATKRAIDVELNRAIRRALSYANEDDCHDGAGETY